MSDSTAVAVMCKGCGAEIVGGSALVNDQGWFHNADCVRAHWKATNYVPGQPPSPMTDLIAELKALKEKATPGPWYQSGDPWFTSNTVILAHSPDPHAACPIGDTDVFGDCRDEHTGYCSRKHFDPGDDAALIVALVNHLPTILAKLEEAGRERDEARAALAKAREAALEEAAKVCDTVGMQPDCPYGRDKPGDPTWDHGEEDKCPVCGFNAKDSWRGCTAYLNNRIAKSIRALKTTPTKSDATAPKELPNPPEKERT